MSKDAVAVWHSGWVASPWVLWLWPCRPLASFPWPFRLCIGSFWPKWSLIYWMSWRKTQKMTETQVTYLSQFSSIQLNSDHIGSWTPEMGAVKVTGVLWCFELLTLLACSAVCAACVGVGHHKLRWHHFPIIFNVLFQWLQKSWVFHFQLLLWVLLDQDITHLLNELKKDPENDRNSGNLFVTVLL